MMRRIRVMARREVLEQLRQPWMLGFMASLLVLYDGVCLAVLGAVQTVILGRPGMDERFAYWLGVVGIDVANPITWLGETIVTSIHFLAMAQFLGMTAILAGHATLHDREVGALPFLLLAPLRRVELLAGKMLGAVAVPFSLFLVLGAVSGGLAALSEVTVHQRSILPPSAPWLATYLVAVPIYALLVATIGAGISTLAHDVRTAQQGANLVAFFSVGVFGSLLLFTMKAGVVAVLWAALAGGAGLALALTAGTWLISRDLGR